MSISHRFISSDGLIPSTIFDFGDADMDVSEEMEEIRELLYETIKKNFPRGVAADHLAKVYREEYVSTKLGPELPSNWLEQVKAGEEFEAQSRGPLTILFVRLHNVTNKKTLPSHPSGVVSLSPIVSIGKECTPTHTPLQLATMLTCNSQTFSQGDRVIVVAFTHAADFHIRLECSQDKFVQLKNRLRKEYSDSIVPGVQSQEVCVNGAYALRDSQGDYFRVIVLSPPTLCGTVQCLFIDIGVRGSFPLSNLRLINKSSIELCSPLATRVHLVLDNEGDKREGIDEVCRSILFKQNEDGDPTPVTLEIDRMDKETKNVSYGVKLRTLEGKSIEDTLMEVICAEKENKEKNVSHLPSHNNLPPIGSLSDFDSPLRMEPMSLFGMPRRSFLAHPIYASGPSEISLRQASLDPMPDYLYERLAEESNEPQSILNDSPKIGSFYAANVDGIWQRVQCIRSSKIDPNNFLFYLVDVGAFHYSKASSIRRLNSLSPFKKMLAFKCKLFGVAPNVGSEVWSREAQIAVNEFFHKCQDDPVEVVPRSEWSGWKQLNAPCLPLIEASIRSKQGRDLADWLIYNKLAQPSI